MGSSNSTQDSDQLPKSPLIVNLRNTLKLKIVHQNLTNSLIYQAFANQFSVTKNGLIDRRMNPFCVLELNQEGQEYEAREWVTCCIISPMMAIASPIYICRQDSTFYRTCRVRGRNKESDVFVQVKDIIHLDAHHVVLLVFKEPLWQLGWSGITYLKDTKSIDETTFRLISHPERKKKGEKGEIVYIQKASTPLLKSSHDTFKANNKDSVGCIVCKVIERKPYVVGIQISNINILFFDETFVKRTQQKVKTYLREENRERQYIKMIDLNAYEEQTQW